MRRGRIALILLIVPLVFIACDNKLSLLQGGAYIPAASRTGAEIENSQLKISLWNLTASYKSGSGAATTFQLMPLDHSNWRIECPTHYSATAVETFDIASDPLVIGGLSLSTPQLAAGCIDKEAMIIGKVNGEERKLIFARY
jgi:hypothetical protein